MKKFSNVHEALNFAALNQYSLRFPFICRCNGFLLKVISPALARTIERDRPTLLVSRNAADVLELGYVLSVNAFKAILQSLAGTGWDYDILLGEATLTVLCHAGSGPGSKFSFPLLKGIPEATTDQGEYVLLLSKPQGSQWHRFWTPLETRLLHSTITSAA